MTSVPFLANHRSTSGVETICDSSSTVTVKLVFHIECDLTMGPKRNLTLDLNAATNGGGGSSKRSRGGGGGGGILTSPDVNKLGLTSPQIKQLLERGHGITPTPGAGPSGYIFPPTTTNQGQQELLVKQFAEAQKAQSVPTTRAAKQVLNSKYFQYTQI